MTFLYEGSEKFQELYERHSIPLIISIATEGIRDKLKPTWNYECHWIENVWNKWRLRRHTRRAGFSLYGWILTRPVIKTCSLPRSQYTCYTTTKTYVASIRAYVIQRNCQLKHCSYTSLSRHNTSMIPAPFWVTEETSIATFNKVYFNSLSFPGWLDKPEVGTKIPTTSILFTLSKQVGTPWNSTVVSPFLKNLSKPPFWGMLYLLLVWNQNVGGPVLW